MKHNFKTMPDGRLFISEGPDDEEGEQTKQRGGGKRKRGGGGGEKDELEEMMDEELAQFKKVCLAIGRECVTPLPSSLS